MANRLQHETSPYLLQHANNPVDWYPWGPEALETAQEQDTPVLLSIGYSACHWCHVMERESFEDPDIAAYMNAHFINIKVDREERPDIDDIYMQATLAFNRGSGGWPMTVFLTPDGRPFHAGTYYPPEPRYGMPSFQQVMEAAAHAFQTRRKEVERTARTLSADLTRNMLEGLSAEPEMLAVSLLDDAAQNLIRRTDPVHGGLTRAKPKFPNPVNLELLLRYHKATGSQEAAQVVLFTLRKMAQGGIYDQLGGGFHRYSVDERWLVPHFEKMLYDNALLARVYLHAWQLSNDVFFREIVEDTLDYVLREMTGPGGGFYSTQDADSEGEEGRFFVWSDAELRDALNGIIDNVNAVLAYWGVTPEGNFEGRNILHVADMIERVAIRHGLSVEQMRDDVSTARTLLFTLRKNRVPPGRDEKIVTAWNGMMLAAFAEAARVLGHDDYRQAAQDNAAFLLSELSGQDGRLRRTCRDGQSKINGYLEDYAHVIDGLLELYQTTFETRWFVEAEQLAEIVLTRFRAKDGGFYDTSDDHEELIVRPRNLQDNATPSGNAMMAYVLMRLTGFTGETRYEEAALNLYRSLGSSLSEYPMAFGEMLVGLELYLRRPVEIALIGDPKDARLRAMLDVVQQAYRPLALVALSPKDADGTANPPLLRTRTLRDGGPAAYVCENFVCAAPVTTAEALAALLDRPPEPPPGPPPGMRRIDVPDDEEAPDGFEPLDEA
ncbi:MAG: thioredoxin domain-containing protein [Anaerolineae bacterium]|nr:thioredoxin domain-containing protein [Anaerolineae bacterium]